MRLASLFLALIILSFLAVPPVSAQDSGIEDTPREEPRNETQATSPSREAASYRGSSDEVRPFQTWIEDAVIARGIVVEPIIGLTDFGPGNRWRFGAQAGFEAAREFEAGLRWTLDNLNYDGPRGSQTGMSDLRGYARYRFRPQNPVIAGGAWVDLPVGSEDVGASNFNVDVFGAVRWELEGQWVILGNFGVESVEFGNNRDTGIHIGGGALYPMSRDLSMIAELVWRSASEYGLLSLGLDFNVANANHLRVALGTGFDDAGSDLELRLGFLMGFD